MADTTVVCATISEATSYGPQSELPSNFGAKARGLLWLPPAWVPPFFVISPSVHNDLFKADPGHRSALIAKLQRTLESALTSAGVRADSPVLLRSNAVRETIHERGRYTSKQSTLAKLAVDVFDLYNDPAWIRATEPIGMIVQAYISPRMKGHLSNERRVAEEYRDGLIEMEDSGGFITERRISFRRWRQARRINDGALACISERELSSVLRELLALAAQRTRRVHFEWVWDGSFIHAVQADIADEKRSGTSPHTVLRRRSSAIEGLVPLKRFVAVPHLDSTAIGKLRNHGLYAQHGYWQPTFYQMPDAAVIGRILRGDDDDELASDLGILTKLPLVIRTSCTRAYPGFCG